MDVVFNSAMEKRNLKLEPHPQPHRSVNSFLPTKTVIGVLSFLWISHVLLGRSNCMMLM